MKQFWASDPLNFALGAASVGVLLGLIVPVTRLERETIPAAVDAVRATLQEGSANGHAAADGTS